MEKYLINEIKKMEGSLIGLGITNEKIKDEIQKNKNIVTCYLLDEKSKRLKGKKFSILNKGKTINIKKIKSVFKKKRIDNIICDYELIKPFLKTFVRDSVYINKNKLYVYGNKDNYDELVNKYKRYTDDIQIIDKKDKIIIVINNSKSTNNKIKDIGYWWNDTFSSMADILTSILVN